MRQKLALQQLCVWGGAIFVCEGSPRPTKSCYVAQAAPGSECWDHTGVYHDGWLMRKSGAEPPTLCVQEHLIMVTGEMS